MLLKTRYKLNTNVIYEKANFARIRVDRIDRVRF